MPENMFLIFPFIIVAVQERNDGPLKRVCVEP